MTRETSLKKPVAAARLSPDASGEYSPLPDGWRWVLLGEVCEINHKRCHIQRSDEDKTSFVPMAAVSAPGGIIKNYELKPYKEIRKGFTYFQENDVLFAKITPCMQNGKHAIARNLVDGIGFGSTEFHVLRAHPKVLPEWIWHFVRQPEVLTAAVETFQGAVGHQRVPASFLQGLTIPLPPFSEQRRIVASLEDAFTRLEAARTAIDAQIEAAKALPAAYLREVFEGEAAKKWPRKKVADLCTQINYGYTASAKFINDGPRFLRITDIQNGKVQWDKVPGCDISERQSSQYLLESGDILFARTGGTTGKSFLIYSPPEAVFASYLIRLRPSGETDPTFLYHFFQSDDYWTQIRFHERGGAQPNVNASLLASIVLSVPPLARQRQVAAALSQKITRAQALLSQLQAQRAALDALPAAYLKKAFAGELVQPQPRSAIQTTPIYAPVPPMPSTPVRRTDAVLTYRCAIGSDILENMNWGRDLPFGRTHFAKGLYGSEAYAGCNLQGQYLRQRWGPLDMAMLEQIDKEAADKDWFSSVRIDGHDHYSPGKNIGELREIRAMMTTDQRNRLYHLYEVFRGEELPRVEEMATIYAVWNDFILDGITPTDEDIVREVRENWHAAKARRPISRWHDALFRMRLQNFVPTGTGPHTIKTL